MWARPFDNMPYSRAFNYRFTVGLCYGGQKDEVWHSESNHSFNAEILSEGDLWSAQPLHTCKSIIHGPCVVFTTHPTIVRWRRVLPVHAHID